MLNMRYDEGQQKFVEALDKLLTKVRTGVKLMTLQEKLANIDKALKEWTPQIKGEHPDVAWSRINELLGLRSEVMKMIDCKLKMEEDQRVLAACASGY